MCSCSSGKPMEPTEIYPGTKCNAVPITDFFFVVVLNVFVRQYIV